MATIRSGAQPVLMIVDVQVGVIRDAWDAPRIVANIARALERARAAKVPVILDVGELRDGTAELIAASDILISSERAASELAPRCESM